MDLLCLCGYVLSLKPLQCDPLMRFDRGFAAPWFRNRSKVTLWQDLVAYTIAITSISTSTSNGRRATSIVVRAGGSVGK